MLKNLVLEKQNPKSVVYGNDKYKIKLKSGGYAFPPKSLRDYLEEEGLAYFDILEVTNKETGKKAQTRVFQPDPIGDIDWDCKHKSQFKKSIWDKID